MSKHLFVVTTWAKDNRVAELQRWYEEQHIPDLLAIPGIVSAQRYKLTPIKMPPSATAPDCITIYEIHSEDPLAVMREMGRRVDTGQIPFTSALDRDKTMAYIASEP